MIRSSCRRRVVERWRLTQLRSWCVAIAVLVATTLVVVIVILSCFSMYDSLRYTSVVETPIGTPVSDMCSTLPGGVIYAPLDVSAPTFEGWSRRFGHAPPCNTEIIVRGRPDLARFPLSTRVRIFPHRKVLVGCNDEHCVVAIVVTDC